MSNAAPIPSRPIRPHVAASRRRPQGPPRVRPRALPRPREQQGRTIHRWLLAATGVLLLLIVSVYEATGLNRLLSQPVIGSDYVVTAEFVAAWHKPGEPVFVALPTQAYLALGSRDDLIFISSPLDRSRAQRYTRLTSDGRYVDYWTGVTSIVSTGQLCQGLLSSPDLWMLVDGARLAADWAYLGDMATVINGLTYVRYYDQDSGAMVRRLAPLPSRDPIAEHLCRDAMRREGLTLETGLPG